MAAVARTNARFFMSDSDGKGGRRRVGTASARRRKLQEGGVDTSDSRSAPWRLPRCKKALAGVGRSGPPPDHKLIRDVDFPDAFAVR